MKDIVTIKNIKSIKSIKIVLLLLIMFCVFRTDVCAKVVSFDEAKRVTSALGIMQGYDNGSFGDYDIVTRAELAKILIASSKYRDLVPEVSFISPFSDVKYNHWAASYISTCVSAGYITGCDDGTYKPDRLVKYEEAVCGLLRVLGYSDEDIQRNYPYGVIAIAKDLGISDNIISLSVGKELNRMQMAMLIYNTLSAQMKGSNQKLVDSLGYDITSSEISSNDIVYQDAIGPIVALGSSWARDNGIDSSNVKVYKNGVMIPFSNIEAYNVIYYSKNLNTIWVYDDKIVGIYQEAIPNKENPTKVKISGKEYEVVGTARTDFAYSGYVYGSAVVGILDRDGKIITVKDENNQIVSNKGIVIGSGIKNFNNSNGKEYSSYYVTLLSFLGDEYTYEISKNMESYVGKVVEIEFKDGISVSVLKKTDKLSGKVSASKLKIGNEKFASNPVILDYNTFTETVNNVTLDRLDECNISDSDVMYFTKNERGEILSLVVKNLTYDSYSPGYITSKNSGDTKTYTADIAGKSYSLSGESYTSGASLFKIKQGKVEGVRSIINYSISNVKKVYDTYVETKDGVRYKSSEDMIIYRVSGGSTMLISIDEMKDDDNISAYLDNSSSLNGRVRIIVVY